MKFENKQKIHLNRRLFYFLLFLSLLIPVLLGFLVSRFFCYCTSDDDSVFVPDLWQTPEVKDSVGVPPAKDTSPKKTKPREIWNHPRLPPHIAPLYYSLTLYPVFAGNESVFYGNESIVLLVKNATRYIVLHSKGMNVSLVGLALNSTGQEIQVQRCFFAEKLDYWVVETADEILANQFLNLTVKFQGMLTQNPYGFFKKTYTDTRTGTKRFLASTAFEPIHARKAFPCFDEPHLKAEFWIHLIHKPVYVALSNMPNESTMAVEWGSDLVQTRFQRSAKMSTFAVSFTVGDFLSKGLYTSDKKLLRAFAPPDQINQTDFALHFLNSTLAFYTNILNNSYPLPKLDIIAIQSRLTENNAGWGLISFPDTALLLNETHSSPQQKILVARGIAHEVAHMWFGNLITMEWWDDFWFKEGISSFFETVLCARLEPDAIDLHISVLSTQETMEKDAQPDVPAILTSVESQEEIISLFEDLTWKKGAAMFHMLQKFVGEPNFYEAIRLFVKRFQWSTTTTADLWQTFNDVVKSLDVSEIMKSWITQPGFPVISVNYDYSDPVDPRLDIQQSRLRSDFEKNRNKTQVKKQNQSKWFVPLDYITSESKTMTIHWMNKTDTQIQLGHPASPWIKFNLNCSGYYRVNYPPEIWQYFSDTFQRGNFQGLSPLDRSGLLDDAIALASSGYLDYTLALNMTLYLDKEFNYIPWKTISALLYRTNQRLKSDKAYSNWRKYVLSKITPVLDHLEWKAEGTTSEKLLQKLLMKLACDYEAEMCLHMASEKFKAWIRMNKSIDYDLRHVVYNYGMQYSETPEDWDVMWNRYRKEENPQEQKFLLFGLAQTKNLWLIQRFIWFALDDTKLKSEAFLNVMDALVFNPVGRCLVWEWIRENIQFLTQSFSSSQLEYLVYKMAKFFDTEFQLNQVLEVFQKIPSSEEIPNYRNLTVKELGKNTDWMRFSKPKIVDWLIKYHNF